MIARNRLIFAFILFGMQFGLLAGAQVAVTRIDYKGWKDACMMRNRTTTLIFVPQIGRIMFYGFTNGENVLWENPDLEGKTPDPLNLGKDWQNFGGDKLWPAPQSRWGWPPSPTLDRGGCSLEIASNGHLQITGTVDPILGIGFKREIALDSKSSRTTFRNTLTNASKQEMNWSVWQITQVNDPDRVLIPASSNPKFPFGFLPFGDAQLPVGMASLVEKSVVFKRDSKSAGKIGSDAPPGWIEAVFNGNEQPTRFRFSAKYEQGKEYPDEGRWLQIYGNADPAKYVEMEILSPMAKIAPGKTYSFVTQWELKSKESRKAKK